MSDVTVIRTPAETGLSDLFDRLKGGLPGDVSVREAALAGFGDRGLPHRRVEEFKYFDLRSMMREALPPAEKLGAADLAKAFGAATVFAEVPAARVTIVNGHYAGELSEASALPAGVEVTSLADAMGQGHPALAEIGQVAIARDNPVYRLNTAFMSDGAVVSVAPGTEVAQPLMIRVINSAAEPFSTATRILVQVGAGASLTLLEAHEGVGGLGYQTNTALEFVVGDGATVRHVRVNGEGDGALAVSTLTGRLGADVSFNTLNVVYGSASCRHQVFVCCEGENTNIQIDGVSMLKGKQHSDATLVVDHAVPHCTSREAFKTILDDDTTGVFQGKAIVRPHAQKTDGGMKSDTLLLSDGATMNNKPELEIFADDVVCGHGATCGALDDELLFYLKSRGLPQADAESLLLQAFVGPPLEAVENEAVRDALIGIVESWLAARR